MQRNTVVAISDLRPGDRFYKIGDKKKEVWEKVMHEVKKTNYSTYSQFAKRDADRGATAFKKDTRVVFLVRKESV